MDYGQHIMTILYDVGERGISARLLARHVYNMNRTLFAEPDMDEVSDYIRKFLRRNYRAANPVLERTGKRGYYRLNARGMAQVRQQLQSMNDDKQEVEENREQAAEPDLPLSLFNDL